MRLGSQVKHSVDLFRYHEGNHPLIVADIRLHEAEVFAACKRLYDVPHVGAVRYLVHADHAVVTKST
eukprot:CAMPEP_0185905442 /NCGR_PEP_ID=MMETSP0196C-20130402/4646_1 /TAXON_ID=2932 /ORGANISM="Alexandrium fundyense, Strain CCMP1719" /LENGTH=66 /DNA_ID=CAMNT_0028624963 /DNA_START=84 /DNA_END=281 /DNA_ORIENTATION=-